jgi:glycerol-3-phosphate responsive antiterminator
VLDAYPDLKGSDTYENIQRALKGETIHIEFLKGINQTNKFFDIFFIALYENKKIKGILSIIRDITTLVNANENLK